MFRGAGAEAARPFVLALVFVLAGSCVLGTSVLQGQSGGVQREASLACAGMRKVAGPALACGPPRRDSLLCVLGPCPISAALLLFSPQADRGGPDHRPESDAVREGRGLCTAVTLGGLDATVGRAFLVRISF